MVIKWELEIPQLTGDTVRTAYLYLPDEYEEGSEQRYPVLYMFDGQNLFYDEDASYGKSWGLLSYLEENNVPLIVTGVSCNSFPEDSEYGGRLSEYSPFSFNDRHFGDIKGRGQITMEWLINEYKPYIDENFPTLPDRKHTFIAGSSMGGLMTLYAISQYNDVFSRGAALSPSLYFSPKEVSEMIMKGHYGKNTVLYMDNGQREFYLRSQLKLYSGIAAILCRKKVLLTSRIVPRGVHNEASWEKQLPFFIPTLLYDLD